jgi:hypothetical protein
MVNTANIIARSARKKMLLPRMPKNFATQDMGSRRCADAVRKARGEGRSAVRQSS